MMDFIEEYWPLVLCGIALVLLLALYMYGTADEKAKCEAAGGSWEVVGEYTYYMKSGSILVPMKGDRYDCIGGDER